MPALPDRPCQTLTLEQVPPCPFATARLYTHGEFRVYDQGDCRWRFDRRGLRVFIRYYPDKAEGGFPWQELYSRPTKH